MKSLFSTIAWIILGSSALAQSRKDTCRFLNNLTFKNGRDTIIVKATLYGMSEAPPRFVDKSHRHRSIYDYKFGTEISFIPTGCAKMFTEPITDSACNKALFSQKNINTTVYVKCIVFSEYFDRGGEPDAIVINVSRRKPGDFK